MKAVHKGALLSVASALAAAVFLLPYKQACTLAARDLVVMTTMLAAAVLNSSVALTSGWRQLRLDRISIMTGLMLGILTVTGNLGTAMALSHVDAGVISTLQQTQILFVPMASFLLLRERITIRFAIGTAVVLVGILVMRVSTGTGSGIHILGIVWSLVSASSFALMHVITRRVIDRIQPVTVNAFRLWLSVGLLLCIPGNPSALAALSGEVWLLCAAAAFMGPFLARVALMFAVRHITASHSVMITLILPVFAFTLDFAVLGAVPTMWQLIGAAVMLVGVSLPVFELMASESRQLPSGER